MTARSGTAPRAVALAAACFLISFVYALLAGYRDGHLVMWITLVRSAAAYGLGLLLALAVVAVRPLFRRMGVPFSVLALAMALIVVTVLAILNLWGHATG